jgi:hypothetical protein
MSMGSKYRVEEIVPYFLIRSFSIFQIRYLLIVLRGFAPSRETGSG